MSSRNNYLTADEREKSAELYRVLMASRDQAEQGASIRQAEKTCSETLANRGFFVDYVTIRETSNLAEVSDNELSSIKTTDGRELVILAAAKIGKTRLIDNIIFTINGCGISRS